MQRITSIDKIRTVKRGREAAQRADRHPLRPAVSPGKVG